MQRKESWFAMVSQILLVVDDRSQMAQIRKAALERLGYAVRTACNSYAALKVLQEEIVSAVLMDYKGEGMDAEAVAFHIRQGFPQQPIVLLSAYSGMPERILWLVDEYVMRSTPPEALGQVIERVAQKYRPASPTAPKARPAAAA
jgi:CheY-like chemotaxis protein